MNVKSHNIEMLERSGKIKITNKLVSFIYELMRDHITPGVLESIVQNSLDSEVYYTNGWLALYAEDIAKRLTDSKNEGTNK